MTIYMNVASVQEILPGARKVISIDRKQIVLFNIEGRFYAIDDACPHQGAALSEGELEGASVVCPWHGALFDLATGTATRFPLAERVSAYEVRLDGSAIAIVM
jgi:nitrite reductase/ring-hydroxylating ferredoxin subunit